MKRLVCLSIVCAFSCAVFAQPFIAVVSPNGGEQIAAGSRFTITWQSSGVTGDVLIEYSVDNGQNWTPVSYDPVPNTGIFDWQDVPPALSRNCLVDIRSADDQAIHDTSDAAFVIYRCVLLMLTDVNRDCYIGMDDLAWMAAEWLQCGNPLDDQCLPPDSDCPTGFGDCDTDRLNGCETDLSSTVDNCGQCSVESGRWRS